MIITYIAELILIYVFVGGFCLANEEDVVHVKAVKELPVDEGGNLTLPCVDSDNPSDADSDGESQPLNQERQQESGSAAQSLDRVYWIHEGRTIDSTVLQDNSLFLQQVKREDGGIYKCSSSDTDEVLSRIKVIVRTVPPRLVNVTVHPSTILAMLRWDVEDTGGYPISHFTAQYRLKHSPSDHPPDEWHKVIPGRISPAHSQIDVYKLKPNSTYIFEVWATNELGEGEVVQVEGTTHHDTEEIELARHLLKGAETFDPRSWVVAVAVVMGTLIVLALGTCFVLYRECRLPLKLFLEKKVQKKDWQRSEETSQLLKIKKTAEDLINILYLPKSSILES